MNDYEAIYAEVSNTAHDTKSHTAGIAAVVTAAKRDAWDEGHNVRKRHGKDDCMCQAWSAGECACGLYGTGALISLEENPYRKATQ